jgi:hypothetical protein
MAAANHASELYEDRQKSSEAGFDSHLVKPVDYATLTGVLNKITTHRIGNDFGIDSGLTGESGSK